LNSFKACSGSSSFFAIGGNEGTAMTKGNQRTLSGIVHILDIRTLPLIAIPVIRVIETVILINAALIDGNRRSL
jgi:hypothetical protein